MFSDVNSKVATIATEVGKTPESWNSRDVYKRQVGSTALKISHVGGQDWNLVDDDTGDLIRHFYFVAAVVYDGMGLSLIHI